MADVPRGWITERSPQPWRMQLRTASYRNAAFHIEIGAKESGQRLVLHEYPKRNDPYTESMGRRAIQFELTGYLINGDRKLGMDYRVPRDRLIEALEKDGGGLLVHPTLGELTVVSGRYSVIERRERGGFCIFEMSFVEAGTPVKYNIQGSTSQNVKDTAANTTTPQVQNSFAQSLSQNWLLQPYAQSQGFTTPTWGGGSGATGIWGGSTGSWL